MLRNQDILYTFVFFLQSNLSCLEAGTIPNGYAIGKDVKPNAFGRMANRSDVACGGGVGHDGLAVYSRDVNGRVVPVAVNVHELRQAYGLRDPLCSPQH